MCVLDDRFISSVDIILIETHCSRHNTQFLYNLKMSKCILTALKSYCPMSPMFPSQGGGPNNVPLVWAMMVKAL